MVWNNIPNDERLSLWKKLRQDLAGLDIHKQLELIAQFCFSMPIGARTLDYYSSENWPTPWEILYHGSFCASSISLLIFYTLTMSTDLDVELLLVNDENNEYLLPLISNQYILNYHLGQISSYPDVEDQFTVEKRYTRNQIKKIT